ncbi:hypothetical protein OAL71_01475 [Phycisphaerales bacterium]|nr:hypothetical protein [Phycisphaerales bacterium]
MVRRFMVHGPLFMAAFLCEVGLLVYTFAYERQIAPVGVFSLLGLAGTGGLTILIELLKLPLAVHSNGTRGIYRVVVMGFVLLLCGMTFMTVKDLVNNQAILSLAPANALFAEAELLEAENRNLDILRDRRQGDADAAREAIITTEQTTESKLETLRADRAAEASLWASRMATATENSGLAPAAVAELQRLASQRDQVKADADLDLSRLDDLLSVERGAHAAALEAANREHLSRLEAWEKECERQRESLAAQRAAEASTLEMRMAAFDRATAAFEAASDRLMKEREGVTRELARRIADHEEKDGAFYNLSSKVNAEKAWAASEFSRIDTAMAKLVRPQSPMAESDGDLSAYRLPARPVSEVMPTSNPEIERLLTARRSRIDRRDLELKEVDARVTSIREASIRSNEKKNATTNAAVARLSTERDARLAEFDSAIAEESRRLGMELGDLRAAAATPAEVQAFMKKSTDTIDANVVDINRLRHEAQVLREGTEMHRLADFLRPFMPEASWEARAEMAQAGQAIVLAFIAAIAPAFLLKMAMHHLMPMHAGPGTRPVRRRASFRSNRARRARLHRRMMQERDRRDSKAAKALRNERLRNEEIEAEARRIAELSDQDMGRLRAESRSQLAQAEDHRKRSESDLLIQKSHAVNEKAAEITALNAALATSRLERDAADLRAKTAASEVSNRQEELERAATRRQELRDQQLQDAIEQAERRAQRQADRRVREDITALRVRIDSLETEASDLRKDRADLINDNQGQTALIRRHVRTIAEMREELERLGRTLIDVSEGNPKRPTSPENEDAPDLDIDFDIDDDDDVPF